MKPEQQLESIKKKYAKEIRKALTEVTRVGAEKAMNEVIKRTKDGIGSNGQKLKPLKASTIEFRRRWSAFLAKDTSPAKSNLTATGQLLEALYFRVVGSRFFIKVNTKTRDQGLGGDDRGLNNDQVRQYVEEAGREFLNLSDKEKADLTEFIRKEFEKRLGDVIRSAVSK
jgi:hypothetical protein